MPTTARPPAEPVTPREYDPPAIVQFRGDDRYLTAAGEAKAMLRAHVLLSDALDSLRDWSRYRCDPPLSDRDIMICIEAAWLALYVPCPRWEPTPAPFPAPASPSDSLQDDTEVPFV